MTSPTQDGPLSPAGPSSLPPDVVARLNAVRAFAGRPWQAQELTGGLTNHNYKVTVPALPVEAGTQTFVARLSTASGALLAIDRDVEHACSVAAARTGVAPMVVDYVPQVGVLVIEWVEGRTYGPEDLRIEANLPGVATALRRLHAAERFPADFDMFAIQRRYLDVVQRNGFRLPERYLEFMPTVERIRGALSVRDEGTVPCHNDLLAANLIDDGEQVWLIDYEYAGNNDPCFELGNLWSESNLAPEQLDHLIELYYGKPLRHKVARARLLGLMSKYGWTLWAAIQDGISGLDFDFWSWGMEKYDRAVAEFDGPDLERWIDEAQRPD
ncbi:MAG: phosphotransferase [Kineosporiaceae bacterium]